MVAREEVWEALKTVYDPELGWSIVDLGLVNRIEVQEDRIEIDFTLTSPGCPVGDELTSDIFYVISTLAGTPNVYVKIVWDKPWSWEKMSDEIKLEMGYPVS